MSHKTEITSREMRKALKDLGLTVRTRAYSEFSEARVFDQGTQINGGNVVDQDHLDRYQAFYAFKHNHSVIDDGWRTIL